MFHVGRQGKCAAVQVGGVVTAGQAALLPGLGLQVFHRVILFGGKAKKPMPGGVSWDVGLINAAEREALANALVALGGGVLAQYQSFADVNDGLGKLVVGLASIIVGEAFFGRKTLFRSFMAVVVGAVAYRFLLTIALQMGVAAIDQRLLSTILVTFAISFPLLQKYRRNWRKRRC